MARFNPNPPTADDAEAYRQKTIAEFEALANDTSRDWTKRTDIERARQLLPRIRAASTDEMVQRLREKIAKETASRAEAWAELMADRRRYADCTFANFNATTERQKAALARIQRFAANLEQHVEAGVNVVLFGPCGTGKDHLLTALLRVVVFEFEKPPPVHLFDGCTLAARAKEDRGSPLGCAFDDPKTLRVLAISDPVMAGDTAKYYQLERLTELIDGQYRRRNPTWITINASSREEMNSMLTPPLADRLRDGAFALFADWPSNRRPGEFS